MPAPSWVYACGRDSSAYLGDKMTLPANTEKRLTTRVPGHVQEKLQAAADLLGSTLNQFVVQAALEKAERIIESESTIVLTCRESLRLLDMIENPPPRNRKFLQAQAHYQRITDDVGSAAKRRT